MIKAAEKAIREDHKKRQEQEDRVELAPHTGEIERPILLRRTPCQTHRTFSTLFAKAIVSSR
jgi:hypothetical protein